jgi:hypothetical protein
MPLPDVLFTAAEATPLLGLKNPRTIQQWVRRDKLRTAGFTSSGAQLFAWPDLVAARTTRACARPIDPIRSVMHALS